MTPSDTTASAEAVYKGFIIKYNINTVHNDINNSNPQGSKECQTSLIPGAIDTSFNHMPTPFYSPLSPIIKSLKRWS
jgi:hypothetical protein